jgi:CheY-like chemotaxis protein/glycine cleavage system H lipoate-binding protein
MGNRLNILIVDDEQIVLDSIGKHLKNESDYNLLTALSVDEAFKVMDKSKVHIILTDLMMPEIDGLEFMKILRDRHPNIIAIMITGYATINTALQSMQLGAFDYLAKPFTREELKKVVKRASELAVTILDASESEIVKLRETETEKIMGAIKGIGEHSWLTREEDGTVLIGAERSFLYSIGRIQTVYLPSVGDELRQGSVYFQVFSTDLRSLSLLSPLTGTVIKVNEDIYKDPNGVLQDPYGNGWLIRINPTNFDTEIKLMGR